MPANLLFYNPGLPINEIIAYDHPFRLKLDPRSNQPAYYQIRVEEQGFFEVPVSVTIIHEETGTEQEAPIPDLYKRIMSQYRERGVTLVEKDPPTARQGDDHIAPTKAEAKTLGDEFHRNFLRVTVNQWFQIVEQARAAGGVPVGATGLFKYALKKLHIADPADRVDSIEHVRESAASNKELENRIAALTATVNQLLGAKNGAPVVPTK